MPLLIPLAPFRFFRKFANIFVTQGAQSVTATPAAMPLPRFALIAVTPTVNLPPVSTTLAVIATGVNDTEGYCHRCQRHRRLLPPVSTAPTVIAPVSTTLQAVILPLALMTPAVDSDYSVCQKYANIFLFFATGVIYTGGSP